MRIVLLMGGAAAAGALLTYLFLEDRQAPQPTVASLAAKPDRAGEASATDPPAPGLLAGGAPPSPSVEIDGSGGVSVVGDRSMDPSRLVQGRMIQAVQKAFSEKLHRSEARVQELEGEIARRDALPKPEVVEKLEQASIAELVALAAEIKHAAGQRLLTPPAHLETEYADLLQDRNAGTARLLVRGKYETLVSPRGGGAYWSFVKRSNSYDEEPDLELQGGYYSTGFAGGDHGYLMDLGNVPIASVFADPDRAPAHLDERGREQWAWLWRETEAESERRPDRRRIPGKSPDLEARAEAVIGHTYLLRAILHGDHDVLVVFRAVEEDEHGHALVWRILKQFEMPSRR